MSQNAAFRRRPQERLTNHVDSPPRTATAVYICCLCPAPADPGSDLDHADADGYFSEYRYSCCRDGVAVHRASRPNRCRSASFFRASARLTTTVNDIEHIESQSLNGIGVIKIFFQPKVNIAMAVAQVAAIAQTQLRQLPQGTTPPLVMQYSASSVPIIQLGLSGEGLSEQQLNDYGLNFIRTQLVTVNGAGIPYPYGGKQRQVQVDLNLQALQSKGLSPTDVVNAISTQNLILPSGTAKVSQFEYQIETNSAPDNVSELNDLPIRAVNGAIVYIRDVAHVRDGFPPQTNIVRVDGQRASLLSVIKTGDASTLDIVGGIQAKLPG